MDLDFQPPSWLPNAWTPLPASQDQAPCTSAGTGLVALTDVRGQPGPDEWLDFDLPGPTTSSGTSVDYANFDIFDDIDLGNLDDNGSSWLQRPADDPLQPPAGRRQQACLADIWSTMIALTGHLDRPCTAEDLKHELLGRGMPFSRSEVRASLALAWPEQRPELDGLQRFVTQMFQAYTANPSVFDEPQALETAFVEAATYQGSQRALRGFLMSNFKTVAAFLSVSCTGAMPNPDTVETVWTACERRKLVSFNDMVLALEPNIVDILAAWGRRGLPAHWSAIKALLVQNKVTLDYRKVERVSSLLRRTVAQDGPQLFLAGQRPARPQNFNWTSTTANIFRGHSPDADIEDDASTEQILSEGYCNALLRTHPEGFTRAQAHTILEQLAPQMSSLQRRGLLASAIHSGLLVQISRSHYTVEPNLLCKDTGAALLTILPDRRSWLSKTYPYDGDAEPPASGTGARRGGSRGASKGPPMLEQTSDAARACAIFAAIDALIANNTLKQYIAEDAAGEPFFKRKELTEHIEQTYPHITQHHVTDTVKRLRPGRIEQVLAEKQWNNPRPDFDRLDRMLQSLRQEIPFFHHLSHPAIASLLNERAPAWYVDKSSLHTYVGNRPGDKNEAQAVIAGLVEDKRISTFYKRRTNGTKLDRADKRAVPDRKALFFHLALEGVRCDTVTLDNALDAEVGHRVPRNDEYLPERITKDALERSLAMDKIAKESARNPGDPAQPWAAFIAAFEKVLCVRGKVRPNYLYSGGTAAGLYVAMQTRTVTVGPQAIKRPGDGDTNVAKRMRGDPFAAVASTIQHNPMVMPDSRWQKFDGPVQIVSRPANSQGGFASLHAAICNMLQDPLYCVVLQQFLGRGAGIQDALTMPMAAPGQPPSDRTTPDGMPLVHVHMTARVLTALAPMLFAMLDAAVLLKEEASGESLGHFAALRRSAGKLFYLDGRVKDPVNLHTIQRPLWLADNNREFSAVLPSIACHGPVGQFASYRRIDCFLDACDALQVILGDQPPVLAFAAFMDHPLGLVEDAPHDALDAQRRLAYDGIELGHLTAFLRQQGVDQGWRPVADLPEFSYGRDAVKFTNAIMAQARQLQPGQFALLKIPGEHGIVALSLRKKSVTAHFEGRSAPWGNLMRELIAGDRQGVRDAALFMPTDMRVAR